MPSSCPQCGSPESPGFIGVFDCGSAGAHSGGVHQSDRCKLTVAERERDEWFARFLIERDKIRELVIEMRKYILHHSVAVGDCVAWHKLKLLADVEINDERDWQKCLAWLEARKR